MTDGRAARRRRAARGGRAGSALVRGAWFLLACGLVGSGVAGWWSYRTRLDAAHERFERSADDVGTAVGQVLRRNTDIVALLRAEIGLRVGREGDPSLTNDELAEWLDAANVGERYEGGIGYAYIQRVADDRLGVVLDQMAHDPAVGLGVDPSLGVMPPGDRGEYCLFRLMVLGGAAADQWVTGPIDACAPTPDDDAPRLLDALRLSAASAEMAVSPPTSVSFLEPVLVATVAPIYRDGAVPATPAERRADVVGWAAASFDPDAIVSAGLAGRDELHVAVFRTYRDGSRQLVNRVDRPMADRGWWQRTVAVPMSDGDWELAITAEPALPLGDLLTSVGTTVAGASVSVLLFLLVWLPARSRARALAVVEDTTAELRHLALHDSLTGLPNRAYVMDQLERLVAAARSHGGWPPVSVLYLDLDKFKDVNDTLGHGAGDELLCLASRRLVGAVRAGDTVGRLGGDEFVVLVTPAGGAPGPPAVAERILEVFEVPFELSAAPGVPIRTSASIGVATGSGAATAGELLRDADLALYQAKANGRNTAAVFTTDMREAAQDRFRLEADLASVLERGELRLVYQPIVDMGSGAIRSFESLLRWDHPERGILTPGDFLPLAEETGAIVTIGRWVVRHACRQAAYWRRRGFAVPVSVNVSASQLAHAGFIDDLRHALVDFGLPPGALVIEVSEADLIGDSAGLAERLRAVRYLGVRLALDDFGTGYASFASLRDLPVDVLKIDRSIVTDLDADRLVRTLVDLGRALGVEIVAEGIEHEEQRRRLRARCEQGQGWLFSPPVTPAEVEAWMADGRVVGRAGTDGHGDGRGFGHPRSVNAVVPRVAPVAGNGVRTGTRDGAGPQTRPAFVAPRPPVVMARGTAAADRAADDDGAADDGAAAGGISRW
ncbi:MAG: EAL domain-containing protein [Actinomycetota bacterium]|nr:EAL domain-containing protein [Actinomycetota bacterium]